MKREYNASGLLASSSHSYNPQMLPKGFFPIYSFLFLTWLY